MFKHLFWTVTTKYPQDVVAQTTSSILLKLILQHQKITLSCHGCCTPILIKKVRYNNLIIRNGTPYSYFRGMGRSLMNLLWVIVRRKAENLLINWTWQMEMGFITTEKGPPWWDTLQKFLGVIYAVLKVWGHQLLKQDNFIGMDFVKSSVQSVLVIVHQLPLLQRQVLTVLKVMEFSISGRHSYRAFKLILI